MEKKKFRVEKITRYSVNASLFKGDLIDAVFERVCDVVEDIIEGANIEVALTDEGIGPYECHGQCGVHRDWQYNVTGWKPDVELFVYCPSFILDEERKGVEMSILDAITEEGTTWADADDGESIECRLNPAMSWDRRHMAFKLTFEWEVNR